jgi:hypothetical protein
MPIIKLFKEQGSFDPEEVAALCNVLDDVMQTLGLVDIEDPLTEAAARALIEIAKAGVSDPDRLKALTIQSFTQQQQQQHQPHIERKRG